MATYYVDSTATGGGDTGADWANAFLTFAQAVTAATTANDLIYVSHAHSESLSANTTYTFGAAVRVFCVNSSTGALATTAVIGAQSTNYSITVAGAYSLYWYGIKLQTGTNTNVTANAWLGATDGQHIECEQCTFTITGASTSGLQAGVSHVNSNVYALLRACTVSFGNAGHTLKAYVGLIDFQSTTLSSGGTAPTNLFGVFGAATKVVCSGCDFSHVGSNTLIADRVGTGTATFEFANCKIGTGSVLAAPTTVLNKGQTSVWLYNCNSGDNHYALYHADAFGETSVSTSVYANDGAAYDGTNKCSWKIVTTANCSYYTPYVSPWMDVYHTVTSAITPYLEILRDGSATAYQDDEVWSEWSYQGTSGSTKATIVSDRMTPLGTAADQTASSLGASDWTGENATAWFGKLAPTAAIKPEEIGHIRARVCVGEPSTTVYVDPLIRGLG